MLTRAIALVVLSFTLSGCVSGEVKKAVHEWREKWDDYKRITSVSPTYTVRYGREGIAAVASRRAALDLHLDATEELVR